MHNRWALPMQVDERIDDWRQQRQGCGERKPLSWVLFAQDFQVLSLDVTHEHIHPLEFVAFEHAVHAGQGRVIESFEELPFKDEAFTVALVRVDQLFEGKQVLLDSPIADQVDRTGLPLTKQTFDGIAVSRGVSYDSSKFECQLFCMHVVPYETQESTCSHYK